MARSQKGRPPAGPLVACVGGPMNNQWFTKSDWTARMEASRYMHEERGQRRSPCLDYRPSGGYLAHPDYDNATGEVLNYRAGQGNQ